MSMLTKSLVTVQRGSEEREFAVVSGERQALPFEVALPSKLEDSTESASTAILEDWVLFDLNDWRRLRRPHF
jgi:hypothetical protein